MPSELVTERLETLLLARLATSANPSTAAALATDTQRYAPTTDDAARWRDRVAEAVQGLEAAAIIDVDRRVVRDDELEHRTGARAGARWPRWSERILPALALGVRGNDDRTHKRLTDRDAWAAAIVARTLGMWSKGPPPTAAQTCDAVTWRALGLDGAPKRCPAEVRIHFLRAHIAIDAGPPERLLRQLAAKLIGAPRADLKALYPALIQTWLAGGELGAPAVHRAPAAPVSAPEASLVDAVRSAARAAHDGVFGDRKVFISSVWTALRATPPWSQLELDEFKTRLLTAHRRRELELARADLVAAMDPALVAASETTTDGATFHFIVREPVQ